MWIHWIYLLAAILFILGIKLLGRVKTSKLANGLGALGMFITIVITMFERDPLGNSIGNLEWIIGALILGSVIGAVMAAKVQMTAMPQMVGLLNGFGGGASAIVASVELIKLAGAGPAWAISTSAGILIGWVTLTGSLVAFGKLQGLVSGQPITLPGFKAINILLALASVAMSVVIAVDPSAQWAFWVLSALAGALGVLLVIPIGGADMPVVISLLNSYSGMAACATGFAIGSPILIITGALVGASGIILTQIMCKAMNRSLMNVMFAAVGKVEAGAAVTAGQDGKSVRGYSVDDIAIVFDGIQRVIIVPGYGMAVSQAQHAVKQLSDVLQSKGVQVKYAIHPVAGRMPGHMNVLLAEANVPYDQLFEMDQINPEFTETDVALVVGANDITNPSARTKKDSPLYGMPILDVDKARTVIVCKRSMNPGFAGIDNELYLNPKTMMLFGDAKKSIGELTNALKG
jgi:NAD(P) transhydrogenase subunit beta